MLLDLLKVPPLSAGVDQKEKSALFPDKKKLTPSRRASMEATLQDSVAN